MNAAANLWKHRDEWSFGDKHPGQKKILEILDVFGFSRSELSFIEILSSLVLVSPPRLAPLISHLEAWRDAISIEAH